jgi:hypothetical protein
VAIRLSSDPVAEIWKYDGVHEAKFSSFAGAARVLETYSDLKGLVASINCSARTGGSFSLKNGVKAWGFYA